MLCRTYIFCYLILNVVFHTGIQNNIFTDYAVRTSTLPTTSCLQFHGVRSAVCCFSTCLTKLNYFYTFSHDKHNQLCVCCNDLEGSTLTGANWKSYIPTPCPVEYTSIPYSYFIICLKYVAIDTKYPVAVNYCKTDGGDLIRLDSQQKYDIFKAHLAPFAALGLVQVWVQAEEHGTDWKFHDGTPYPNYCPIQQSNSSTEIHVRYRSDSHKCVDAPPTSPYHYVCEIYRRFAFHN